MEQEAKDERRRGDSFFFSSQKILLRMEL